jgi:DNA-binding transcriptional ArsR family regulator
MPSSAAIHVLRGRSQAASLLHKARRELIELLAEPGTAAGLAKKLGTSRQRLRYHLRQLEAEGLIECVTERRSGNCVERVMRATARSFVISPEAIGKLGDTPEPSAAAADRFSAAYLMGSAARAVRDVAELEARAKNEGKRLSTLTLQSDIRFASPEARAAFAEELTQTLARLTARYHDEHAPNGRTYRLTALAHPASASPASEAAPSAEVPQSQADGGGDDNA